MEVNFGVYLSYLTLFDLSLWEHPVVNGLEGCGIISEVSSSIHHTIGPWVFGVSHGHDVPYIRCIIAF